MHGNTFVHMLAAVSKDAKTGEQTDPHGLDACTNKLVSIMDDFVCILALIRKVQAENIKLSKKNKQLSDQASRYEAALKRLSSSNAWRP